MTNENTEKARLYIRKKYEERRRLGLCVTCGRPPMEGRVTCQACTIRNVENHRRRSLIAFPAHVIDDLPGEVWKSVTGYEGMYEVSNSGRVKSIVRRKGMGSRLRSILLSADELKNYRYVTLCKNNKTKHHRIHRLVALAFIPNPLNLPMVNHKDGNTFNNSAENLEWVTDSQNKLHAASIGLFGGERSNNAKLNREKVKEIRQLYPRLTTTKLAEIYNVNPSTIERVVKLQYWKYV